jgi:hypothetical protein
MVAVAAAVLAVLARHNRGVVFLLVAAAVAWTLNAALRSRQVMTIDQSTLKVRLALGGVTLAAADVVGARFERIHANGRSLMFNVVIVERLGGGDLTVVTSGWSPDGAWPAIRGWLLAAGVHPEALPDFT